MGRILVHTFASLDGIIDATPENGFHAYMNDENMQESEAVVTASDALLLGRATYQGLAKSWMPQTGPLADRLNSMPKYVLSRTLQSADDWGDTEIIGYDDVPGLRERLQLVSYGCGQLAQDLARDGLLDELQLWFVPVVAGAGTRLFAEPDALLLKLRLSEARAFSAGAARLTYVSSRS